MPRINRVRVHNIHFETGGQPRIYHDTIFEPFGENTLVLLGNGGGKTLLLHLIAQVIEPNATLQGRKIKRLVEKEKFTGHVLVEWLLDGAAPRYLLTGFCFADHIGDSHQGIDYFTYLHEYDGENEYDLSSFPLADEANRTYNLSQLQQLLKNSPVKVYASYRRQDYQKMLKEYQIDPQEWRYILKINDSEGGIENFFEGCSRTRTLLDKLLIPMIDEVLERREERDPLREAFRGTALEVMDLPQLKVQSEALEALSHKLPLLAKGFDQVAQARQRYLELLEWRATLLKTLIQGMARLEEHRNELAQQKEEKISARGKAEMTLEALGVEEKRRTWDAAAKKAVAQEKLAEAARQRYESSRKRLHLYKAFQKWGRILQEEETLADIRQQLQLHEQGEAQFKEELERLRMATAPLLRCGLNAVSHKEEELRQLLERLKEKREELFEEKAEAEVRLGKTRDALLRLQALQEQFQEERKRITEKMADLGISFDAAEPRSELSKMERELERAEKEKDEAEEVLQQLELSLAELGKRQAILSSDGERLVKEMQHLREQHQQWWEQALFLKGELKSLGCPHHPGEDCAAALVWLSQKEEQLAREQVEVRQQQRHWQEQEFLWGEGRTPRPHAEIDRVVEELNRNGITAQPVVELFAHYSEPEREQMLNERPWLPYALVVEPSQLEELKRRRLQLRAELTVPVPLVSRTDFHEGVSPAELYFLSHRGLERFYSEEKIEQYRIKIRSELRAIEEKLHLLVEQEQRARDLVGRLEGFRRGFAYSREADWNEAIRLLEEKRSRLLADLEEIRHRLEQVHRDKDERRSHLQQLRHRLQLLHRALDMTREFCLRWAESKKREEEAARLQERRIQEEEKVRELQQALAAQDSSIDEAKEELKGVQHELERYREAWFSYVQETGAEARADQVDAEKIGPFGSEQERQLDQLLIELKAGIEALEKRSGDYQALRSQEKQALERIEEWKEEIRHLSLELETVQKSYYPVERSAVEEAAQAAEADRRKVEEANRELAKVSREASAAESVYRDRLEQLQKRYPQVEPPDLSGVDLELERKHQERLSKELDESIRQLDEEMRLAGRQLEDYRQAADSLRQMEVAVSEDTLPLPPEQEKAQLLGRAGEVVAKSRHEEKELAAELDKAKRQAVDQLQLCWDELRILHGDELKQFFKMMAEQTGPPSWEQRVTELQGHLRQVEEAINHFREQVRQRLEGLSAKVDEMVRRTWRHVDGVLEQVRELQRRSLVPLRGEKHPLFKISFVKPEEAEGSAKLRKYLEDVIAEAVNMQKQGREDTEIDDFLREAIETSRLLDQVVHLDDIDICLLKPRDSSSYQSGQYDRWDDLNEWSQGQRFAGRFALFIVLLSYIRQCRSGGRVTSAVVLADNPFGQASSSHILEIVDAITRQQNVQLFSCTALRNTEIMRGFPVIYSLVPAPTMGGKERMSLDKKRRGVERQPLEQAHARIPLSTSDERGQLELF
ncbi:MAG: hypothetical protein GX890_05045 [Firmicutes bacterium]|jgi:DNA repair exonuclease SbcCD ATPase subunit|nr:hypothetical protein [Bacillota bacterium]HPU01710.1 hypothetical protein [Bacillota bacterium]